MSWKKQIITLYKTHRDLAGRPVAIGDILLSDFSDSLPDLIQLRSLDRSAADYTVRSKEIKAKLQGYTPAACLQSRQAGNVIELSRTGLLQMDFDYSAIQDFDIDELKQAIFALPFVAFVGLSCSGFGFYALLSIAEPERLAEYAEHCFEIFKSYGVSPDTSKGRNAQDLRYVSYDSKMLIRENPEPLRIAPNKPQQQAKKGFNTYYPQKSFKGNTGLIKAQLKNIRQAVTGQRWQNVQRAAFTLGGLMDHTLLESLKNEIMTNPQFAGEEKKYCQCASDCFQKGMEKPIIQL